MHLCRTLCHIPAKIFVVPTFQWNHIPCTTYPLYHFYHVTLYHETRGWGSHVNSVWPPPPCISWYRCYTIRVVQGIWFPFQLNLFLTLITPAHQVSPYSCSQMKRKRPLWILTERAPSTCPFVDHR